MTRLVPAVLIAALVCTACSKQDEHVPYAGDSEASSASVDPAIKVGEDRLETLADVVRTLRDQDPNMMFPATRQQVADAVAAQHPGQDLMNDGWGRPFVYERGPDGRSYRIYSVGPNGVDEHGTMDDSPMRGGSVELTSGG